MAPRISHLWRHPIKGHGFEAISEATLAAHEAMPWDRVWAIAHDAAKLPDTTSWVPCANFSRGAKLSTLMAIRAKTDPEARTVTLTHRARPEITVNPDLPEDAARLIDWATPLADPDRALPSRVVRAPKGRGMTDSDFPSIAILNRASLAALGTVMGQDLAMERFRGNIWLDGLEPWVEFDWIDRDLRIGGATLRVRERITRCKATSVDPTTGLVDGDTLAALHANWGHRDFGVYAEVMSGGAIRMGDEVTLV